MQILLYQPTDILARENSTKFRPFGGKFTANELVFRSRKFPIL